jgi:hypothetical protein
MHEPKPEGFDGKVIMNTPRANRLICGVALAVLASIALAGAPASASAPPPATGGDVLPPVVCAAPSMHTGPVDIGRARPYGVHLPQ